MSCLCPLEVALASDWFEAWCPDSAVGGPDVTSNRNPFQIAFEKKAAARFACPHGKLARKDPWAVL